MPDGLPLNDDLDLPEPEFAGDIIIEWGPGRAGGIPGWQATIYDAATGHMLPGVMTVTATAADIVTAELRMFTDASGKPLGFEAFSHAGDDLSTAVFRYRVAEMRVSQS